MKNSSALTDLNKALVDLDSFYTKFNKDRLTLDKVEKEVFSIS